MLRDPTLRASALVLGAFDVGGWALRHGARVLGGAELVMACPACGKQDKLCVNTDKRVWHCWICQQEGVTTEGGARAGRGTLVDLVALVERCDRRTAARRIYEAARDAPPPSHLAPLRMPEREPIWALPMPWPAGTEPIAPDDEPAQAYLRARGVSAADVVAFRLRRGRTGRLRDRLVVPVFEDGRLVYYQARAMWQPAPGERFVKCLNPSRYEAAGTTAAKVLLGLDHARQFSEVLVVEGPIDAIRAGPRAVATFGKVVSDHQMVKLREAGVRRLCLCWDGPGPTEPQGAWPEMVRAAPRLASLFEVRLARLPEGDPASVAPEVLWHAVDAATRWRA